MRKTIKHDPKKLLKQTIPNFIFFISYWTTDTPIAIFFMSSFDTSVETPKGTPQTSAKMSKCVKKKGF